MIAVVLAAGVIMLLLSGIYVAQVIRGKTIFDRVAALNGLGTKVPVVIVVIGLIYGRVDMFVDIALGLFLLNLVTTLLIARYVQAKGTM